VGCPLSSGNTQSAAIASTLRGPRGVFGIECEGFEYHGSRLQWKRDWRRTAWLERQGRRLTFVTWDDVTLESEQTLERIRLAS
jgi:hypothetical protein